MSEKVIKKPRLPINFLILISAFLGVYLFFDWTIHGGMYHWIHQIFKIQALETVDQQMTLFFSLGYSTIVVAAPMFGISYILVTRFTTGALKQQLLTEMAKGVEHSFFELMIFEGLFLYMIIVKRHLFNQQDFLLFGFWFIVSRLVFITGKLLSKILKINMKIYGIVMTYSLYFIILAKLNGYNVTRVF